MSLGYTQYHPATNMPKQKPSPFSSKLRKKKTKKFEIRTQLMKRPRSPLSPLRNPGLAVASSPPSFFLHQEENNAPKGRNNYGKELWPRSRKGSYN